MIKKKLILSSILLLGVLLGCYTTTYADGWDDIEYWLDTTKFNIDNGTYPPNNNVYAFNQFYNLVYSSTYWNDIKTYCGSIDNYYVVLQAPSNTWWFIVLFENEPSFDKDNSNNLTITNGVTLKKYFRFHPNGNTLEKNTFENTNFSSANWNDTGKTTGASVFYNINKFNFDWQKVCADNLYTWNQNTAYIEDTQTIGNIVAGNNKFYTSFRNGYNWSINDNGFDFKLYYLNENQEKIYLNNNKTFERDTTNEDGINTNAYIVRYEYTQETPLNTPLYNELYYNSKIVSTSPYFMLQLPQNTGGSGNNTNTDGLGDITNESGDITSQIDLEPIVKAVDNVANLIESGNKKAEERQNFWQQTYERFMQPSGEVIKSMVEETINNLELPSGEEETIKAGLDQILENAEDFRISWNSKSTHLTIKGLGIDKQIEIPSGDINFSKMERENQDLQEVMKYTRAILTFSIISMFFGNLWKSLLLTLGISTQIYNREENNRIAVENQINREKEITRRQIFNRNQEKLREYNKLAKKKGWKK